MTDKLTVKLECTDLAPYNYLVDLISRYKDQLPQAMIDELNDFVKAG